MIRILNFLQEAAERTETYATLGGFRGKVERAAVEAGRCLAWLPGDGLSVAKSFKRSFIDGWRSDGFCYEKGWRKTTTVGKEGFKNGRVKRREWRRENGVEKRAATAARTGTGWPSTGSGADYFSRTFSGSGGIFGTGGRGIKLYLTFVH